MNPHSRAPNKNTSHGNEVLLQDTTHLIQRPLLGTRSEDSSWALSTKMELKKNIYHYFTCPLTAVVVGAPQVTSQPVSSVFRRSQLGPGELQACPFPDVVFPHFFPSALSSLPPPLSTVSCRMVLVRPDERETCPYLFGPRFCTMVRRSSCFPNAGWILAQTSSLVTWPLNEMRSILQ